MLELEGVNRSVGGERHIVDVSLKLARGSVNVLLGPTLAGKTSLMRLMAGLDEPTSGTIVMDGREVTGVPVRKRNVAMVYQQFINYPTLSVFENIASPLRLQKQPKSVIADKVKKAAELMKLSGFLDRTPLELSGGQQQRTALARALVKGAELVLLDEPLAALDAGTRERVRGELGELLREVALPTVLVSHDFEDAAALAERVGILVDGRIVQTGSPAALVADPRTAFVASFTGSNLLRGHARAGTPTETRVSLEGGASVVVADRGEGAVGVVVAPSSVAIAPVAQRGESVNELEVTVSSAVPRGDRVRVASGLLAAEVPFELARGMNLTPGAAIVMSFAAEAARLVPLGDH